MVIVKRVMEEVVLDIMVVALVDVDLEHLKLVVEEEEDLPLQLEQLLQIHKVIHLQLEMDLYKLYIQLMFYQL